MKRRYRNGFILLLEIPIKLKNTENDAFKILSRSEPRSCQGSCLSDTGRNKGVLRH